MCFPNNRDIIISLFGIFLFFGVLGSDRLSAQIEKEVPLTPPKRIKATDPLSTVPSVDSPLVYPNSDVDASHDTHHAPPKPLRRRYADTPTPKSITDGSLSSSSKTTSKTDATVPAVLSDPSPIPRRTSFATNRDASETEAIMVSYTDEVERTHEIDPVHPPIRTASFLNVIPGETTQDEVHANWGEPLRRTRQDGQTIHYYSTEILNHIELTYQNGLVSSIIVRLDTPFPEEQVREVLQTELMKCKPVLIPDATGEIIGEVFPEKGVLFLFAESNPDMPGVFLVRQIGIEPVTSDPFVLRAEATLTTQTDDARRDLLDAIKVNPNDAKAYWLLSKVLLMEGRTDAALLHCEKAIRFDERRPAYHLTLAEILTRMNRCDEAKLYLEETLSICDRYPHEKAKALRMLGDLYRLSMNPDYEAAIEYHSDAIRLASSLIEHRNPTIRQTAKDVLFEAHLGAARDVAWGRWEEKEESIAKWIAQAKEISDDPEMISAKRFSKEYPFKIAVCRLACQVGLPENIDIKPSIEDVIHAGEMLIQSTHDSIQLRKYQWETSLSLYDAVQIYQLRKRYSQALKYGELAAEYMEAGLENRLSETDHYLLGRLYFRLGAIHAIGNKNHRAAIEWFDKAKPVFEKLLPKINPEELGRLGETFVSMGVSYWETGQRDEAIRLTERGLKQIERGAKIGTVDRSAFLIPYSNLAKMHEKTGDSESARRYARLASTVR